MVSLQDGFKQVAKMEDSLEELSKFPEAASNQEKCSDAINKMNNVQVVIGWLAATNDAKMVLPPPPPMSLPAKIPPPPPPPPPVNGSMLLRVPPTPMESCVIALVTSTKNKRSPLRGWLNELAKVFPELVTIVEDVFTHICTSPFTLAYLKDFSRHGFDYIRNKEVDYGNFQYATVLKMMALVNNTIGDTLDAISEAIPSLRVTHADTERALVHQGDVIEALMGLYRHQDDGGFLGLANFYSHEQIKVLFAKLVAVSRIVGNILFASRYPTSPSEGSFLYDCLEEGSQTKESWNTLN